MVQYVLDGKIFFQIVWVFFEKWQVHFDKHICFFLEQNAKIESSQSGFFLHNFNLFLVFKIHQLNCFYFYFFYLVIELNGVYSHGKMFQG